MDNSSIINYEDLILKFLSYMYLENMSIANLAEEIGVSKQTLYRWLTGRYNLSRKSLLKISIFLKDFTPSPEILNYIKTNLNLFL